ncbi:helix-turn-helix domain-containing protein [Hyphomonas sp. FCG-A18]|jgi:AraC-like DNA-binding protein|uniref:helix-turn-helix domain-containing protein n=1 Tax=Hyphomonas sp. FCG-A18 TaxID=3080019 RepID=UPI002B292A9E|nr:helix-turn-helix domain-containing protein [Hyphomonas sp. FCG-A18]
MLNAILNFGAALSILCCLFAVHMFRTSAASKTPALLLGAVFLLLGVHALLLHLIVIFDHPRFAVTLLPLLPLLIGPLLYLFFQSVRELNRPFHKGDLLHALPATIVFGQMTTHTLIHYVDIIVLVSILAYCIALILIAQKGVGQFNHLGHRAVAPYAWLIACIAYLAVSFAADLIILLEIKAGSSADQSLGLLLAIISKLLSACLVMWLALQRKFYFEWIYTYGTRAKYSGADPERREVYHAIIERFEACLATADFFNEPTPSLSTMARRIGAPARQLSEAINETFGESYSKQMNRRRIDRAKNLLAQHQDMPITDIMFESGFQTKSSFNKEFRAIAGMSPTEYRRLIAS